MSNNEEKEKKQLNDNEELKKQLEELGEKFTARDSKYRKLKRNYTTIVSNNSKDAIRARDAAVKIVCEESDIHLSKYEFADVPPNEDIPDSEEEYEESDEEL
ncbi:uncharacterized protein LOC113325334 [Papaver somniferum]|uniref:uncharacterized protein LOC113325334 n=1 Tax=Papaver somniferum TaxID=3469 RepID=UPI000E7052A0|nr:uncharacterized protein LOC113325334 [Papaver somniferum]